MPTPTSVNCPNRARQSLLGKTILAPGQDNPCSGQDNLKTKLHPKLNRRCRDSRQSCCRCSTRLSKTSFWFTSVWECLFTYIHVYAFRVYGLGFGALYLYIRVYVSTHTHTLYTHTYTHTHTGPPCLHPEPRRARSRRAQVT